MNRLSRHLFDFDAPETNGERLFFKLFELMVLGLVIWTAWTWGYYILKIGDVVLPLGLSIYVDLSFMTQYNLSLINAGLITVLLAIGFFRAWRPAYLMAFLLLHVQYAARYVLGEIPHSTNMLGMMLLGLGLAAMIFREARLMRRFSLGFAYFFLGLGYTLAAFSKLIGTGPHWIDGRHMWLWLGEKGIDTLSKSGTLSHNFLQTSALDSQTLATLMLGVSLLTELCAFLMWWKPFRYPVVLAVLGLHLGIYFMLDIIFLPSMYQLVFLGLPWAVLLNQWLTKDHSLTHQINQFSLRFA